MSRQKDVRKFLFSMSVSAVTRTALVVAITAVYTAALFACGPFNDPRQENPVDLVPPVFVGAETTGPDGIELEFNEEVNLEADSLRLSPALDVLGTRVSETKLIVEVRRQEPGTEYTLEAVVKDLHNNTSNLIVNFYGYNPSVPSLLINEFTTNGSETHPDLVELKVTKAGNMAGVVLFAGVKSNWDSRIIFPGLLVQQGDFLLVHFKPQGIATEINETTAKDRSAGLDASANAYDLWVEDGNGLSGNNGVLSLYSSPTGMIIDGVLYSNRTRDSDTLYLGFGTDKTMKRALALVKDSGWKTAEVTVTPEDGVNPEKSTSTRSLCRNKIGSDTDTKSDWHIVPTKKSSFGSENSEEVYAD